MAGRDTKETGTRGSATKEQGARAKGAGRVVKTDAEWRKTLTPEQYKVLRESGTERPFTGALLEHKGKGMYACGGCGQALFASDAKFDSGTGWPSFSELVDDKSVELVEDNSLFSRRTEVRCSRCGGHLGHVFPDGPKPGGMRYCMNSAALCFMGGEGKGPAAKESAKEKRGAKARG